jgi:hypothetical protein
MAADFQRRVCICVHTFLCICVYTPETCVCAVFLLMQRVRVGAKISSHYEHYSRPTLDFGLAVAWLRGLIDQCSSFSTLID